MCGEVKICVGLRTEIIAMYGLSCHGASVFNRHLVTKLIAPLQYNVL